MKTALVLGGTQFFGKRLVQELLDNDIKVTIATRGITPDPFGDKVERLKIDREKKETLLKAFDGKVWDVVFDQTCLSPEEVSFSSEALKDRVKRYIFTSSQAVYDFGANHKEEEFDASIFPVTMKPRRDYVGYIGYQEAKRTSEAYLIQNTNFEVVSVRFPIVLGKDDFTNRLKFHVDHVMNEQSMLIPNLDTRYGFISSKDAADFLYNVAKSNYTGPINPGCSEDMSLRELLKKIELLVGKKAIVSKDGDPSPYGLEWSWSINTEKAEKLGYHFESLESLLTGLIEYYLKEN